ncbi:MAG: hypothetical protein HZA80_02105 [Candidatus Taylorbacteria bacterium]|nr:hypothetical protein [Candidatus Taylorbacteria bacterium]
MNTKSFRFVLAALVSLVFAFTSMAASRTIQAGRISAPSYDGPKIAKQAVGQPSSNYAIQAYPLELPWLSAAESTGTETQIMSDWRSGHLHTAPITTPSGYRLRQEPYAWWHYAVAVNGYSTWGGTNASGVFSGKPGLTAAVLVVVTALDDGDVNLNMLSTICSSPQDGQINEARSFGGLGYAKTAIGVRRDNSVVDSGSGSQAVRQFAVIVYPQLYAASNATELQAIKSWIEVENGGTFAINIDCRVNAGIALTTRAGLSTRQAAPLPALTAVHSGANVQINVPGGVLGHAYLVEGASNIDDTVWTPLAYIGSAAHLELVVDWQRGFLRLRE